MRGERALTIGGAVLAAGSSPHARGTRLRRDRAALVARFIPACAGNARLTGSEARRTAVHPRMRGERVRCLKPCSTGIGSSPHARGTLFPMESIRCRTRFIPACAGNANWRFRARCVGTVHPRMRGERGKCSRCPHVQRGSSPHARGTHLNGTHNPEKLRFIPACAGNAARADGRPGLVSVHPRMRGERSAPSRLILVDDGSSPHARGTLTAKKNPQAVRRFIPACAGNAEESQSGRKGGPVHPRMRGERTSNKLLIYRRKTGPSDSTEHSCC